MSESKDYIAPPKKEIDNVKKDYVAPPKAANTKKTDYVLPPKADAKIEKTAAPTPRPAKAGQEAQATNGKPSTTVNEYQTPNNVQHQNSEYFATPQVGWRFYLTGYLILMLLSLIPSSWENLMYAFSVGSFGAEIFQFFSLAFLIGYILLSNYTFSWFADYHRAAGSFAWFFTPFGSVKAGVASSALMNFQKGTVKKDFFGNYKMTSRSDIGSHVWYFFIIALILEVLKFIVSVPIAFISIFLHKRTIRKYRILANTK